MVNLLIQLIRFYTRYFPIPYGKVPLLLLLGKIGLFRGKVMRSKVRAGFLMDLYIADWVQQLIYFFGDYKYERDEAALWTKAVSRSSVVLDIGSNVGYFSLIAARSGKPEVRVIAFEPAPQTFGRLLNNIRLNSYESKINAIQAGVSDEAGQFELFLADDDNSGMTSLQRPDNFSGRVEVVKIVHGDAELERLNALSPQVIKIDVEGNEMKVLKGLEQTITKSKPVIFVEILDHNLNKFGSSNSEVYGFLRDNGYRSCYAGKDGNPVTYNDNRDIGLGIFIPENSGVLNIP